MKHIYFTVTNDLTFDQRMHRICTSLANAGFEITLIGRALKNSIPLKQKKFKQKRLNCFFNKSFLFYAEYNLRLFFFLFSKKMNAICAIDLDTILPCLYISKLKKIPRIYDAHEYFTELKEVREKAVVKKFWTVIERYAVPKYKFGYTVSNGLAREFKRAYGRTYEVIRNLPVLKEWQPSNSSERFLLYQGAVNEGRGFEYLIPAMKKIDYRLVICGDGNFMQQLKKLIKENDVGHKIELKGMLLPDELWSVAQRATLGIALAEKEGLNQFWALPNKFFDYIHAGLPQIAMNYPEYKTLNDHFKVAVLIDSLSPLLISETINNLMNDEIQLRELHANSLKAREIYCWQNEEKKLINYLNKIVNSE